MSALICSQNLLKTMEIDGKGESIMYDITKKKQFETVGDLKELLKDIPDETKIVVTGDDYCWFHIEQDGSVICLDVEELDEAYEEYENEED